MRLGQDEVDDSLLLGCERQLSLSGVADVDQEMNPPLAALLASNPPESIPRRSINNNKDPGIKRIARELDSGWV